MGGQIATIPDSREVLESYGEAPDATSSLYATRSLRTRKDGIEQHVVVGVHIVFAPDHPSGLYEAYNVSRDQTLNADNPSVATRALAIACDTLEIHGELSLPECELAIYARRLVLRDRGCINTAPLSWATQRASDFDPTGKKGGADGAEGGEGLNADIRYADL